MPLRIHVAVVSRYPIAFFILNAPIPFNTRRIRRAYQPAANHPYHFSFASLHRIPLKRSVPRDR
jgi:hypothetical protein